LAILCGGFWRHGTIGGRRRDETVDEVLLLAGGTGGQGGQITTCARGPDGYVYFAQEGEGA